MRTANVSLLHLAFLLGLAALSSCSRDEPIPAGYFSNSVEGRVVDGRSARSLPGVTVLARWRLLGSYGGEAGELHVSEVMTDENGSFHLPTWGPVARPDLTVLASDAPQVVIFKNGYGFRQLDHSLRAKNGCAICLRTHYV